MEVTEIHAGVWQDFLNLWHENRYIFFVIVVGCIVTNLCWRRFRKPRQRLSASPSPGSPSLGLGPKEKTSWLDPIDTPAEESDTEQQRPHSSFIEVSLPTSISTRERPAPKRFTGTKNAKRCETSVAGPLPIQPVVFFSSLTGTTERYARDLGENLQSLPLQQEQTRPTQINDLSYIDYDDYFTTLPKSSPAESVRYFYILLIPTYNIDTVLTTFLDHLQETHHDFRINTAPLSGLAGYSVFGFGDRQGWRTEQEGFCSQALDVDRWMAKLTAKKRAFPVGTGDVKSDVAQRLREWTDGVGKVLCDMANQGGLGEGIVGSGDPWESDEEAEGVEEDVERKDRPLPRVKRRPKERVDDLEDIKGQQQPAGNFSLPIDFTTSTKPTRQEPKDMVPVTSPTYAALTKQGYTIVGSHSGVKICRWTKSALRGRGSCYKYSFYGIKSHLCMETTPSLSCSNKCVFCWRHGTNPVGTTWRWRVDPPEMIFEGAKEGHLKKIKMMRGVPGVRAERFQEAMRIRHCALSLVGEPIFYPHINEFLELLHKERISSFLVCNAQHPEQLANLKKVTQLYVSIDASNKESLRKVDRPLHRDFWERFLQCLDILKTKRFQMRTVFRLTLVKGFNVEDEAEGYADLVARGLPCFVEVKGVTYCGTSSSAGAGLTMQNVPFYEEVVSFVEAMTAALRRRKLDYGIAAEHAHSCCILIASNRFLIDGQWHTLIDYDKFFACLDRGEEFAPEDYVGPPTPHWATYGNGGFDPADERVWRKGKSKEQTADPATKYR